MLTNEEKVFYDPNRLTIIDVIKPDGKSCVYSESLEQVQQRYPDAEIWGFLDAVTHQENAMISAPVEITEDRFIEMLEILPPVHWVRHGVSESFKMSERTSGSITGIFARIGNRFFEMQNHISMSHEDILRCIAVSFPDTLA